jgi:site-specific recombinase XerD
MNASRAARPKSWDEARDAFIVSLADDDRSRRTREHYRDDIGTFEAWWDENRPGERLLPSAVVDEDIREWKRWLKNEPLNDAGFTRKRWLELEHERERKAKEQRPPDRGRKRKEPEPLGPFVDNGRRRKPAAVNAKLAALKSFLTWCHKQGHIATLPAMPRREKLAAAAVKWLDKDEERRLLRALKKEKRHREGRNLPMVEVMLWTGLRVAELVALEWRDVKLGERKGDVEVRAGKGCKPRVVPLNLEAREAFRRLQELATDCKPTQPVFHSQRQDRLSPRGVQEVLAEFDVHPHQLRHTFVRKLLEAGTSVEKIAKLVGHSSVVTTLQSYATPSETDLRSAVEAIDPGDDD